MSEKSIRKYRDADRLPSQMERPERTYRTRPDPLTGERCNAGVLTFGGVLVRLEC